MKTIKFPSGKTDRVTNEEAAHMVESGNAVYTCKRRQKRKRPAGLVIPTPKTVVRMPKTRVCNNRKLTKARRTGVNSNYAILKATGGIAPLA